MKRLSLFLVLVLFLGVLVYADSSLTRRASATATKSGDAQHVIGDEGEVLCGSMTVRGSATFKSSFTVEGATLLKGDIDIENLTWKTETWVDLAAKSSYSILGVGFSVSTTTLRAGASTWTEGFLQPGLGRTLGAGFDTSVASNVIHADITFTGTNQFNEAASETVIATVTVMNYTSEVFATITSIVISTASYPQYSDDWEGLGTRYAGNTNLRLGTGDGIGFGYRINGDILYGSVDDVDETSSFTISTTTVLKWTHSDVPDGADTFSTRYLMDTE